MKVYLLLRLIDNCAYITEKVCLTKEIAEREKSNFEKRNKNINVNLKIECEKVIEK